MHSTHIKYSTYTIHNMHNIHTITFVTPPQTSNTKNQSIHSQKTGIPDIIYVTTSVFYQYVLYCCTDDESDGSKHVAIYCDYTKIRCLTVVVINFIFTSQQATGNTALRYEI